MTIYFVKNLCIALLDKDEIRVCKEIGCRIVYAVGGGKIHGYYEVNEAEARVVKMIFKWVADEKLTIRLVIRRLQENPCQ